MTEIWAALSTAIAKEILGWHEDSGYWHRGGSCTGLKVARDYKDLPEEGFFRPDQNLWHLELVYNFIWVTKKYAHEMEWGNNKVTVVFSDGHTIVKQKGDWSVEEGNEFPAQSCLELWRYLQSC
jgi:hypothetical protein